MRKQTIDLEDEVEEIRTERIPSIEEARDELVAKLSEEFEEYSEVPKEYRQTYDEFEEQLVELQGKAQALEQAVEDWGDGVFVTSQLTTGQLASIQDAVSEKSFEFDPQRGEMVNGSPKQGFGMVETLREAIIQAPDGAPSRETEFGREEPEPAEYPHQVGLYLFEKVNNFNTVGESDLGNSSLREQMNNYGSS